MTRHKPILTDAEMHALICGNPSTLGLSIARLKDFIRQVEKAVVAKLAEQEPVAWRVHPFDYGIGVDGAYAITQQESQKKAWVNKGWDVTPLYVHPLPCASQSTDKIVCVSENAESDRQLARDQPCGCIVCYCENQVQCLGCGARYCGTHEAGEIPNPVYVDHIPGPGKMAAYAMQSLTKELQADAEYAWSWHCNIAVPIMYSTGLSHREANIAAARLMQHLFGIDTEKHPNFEVDHIPDAKKMIVPEGYALVPVEITIDMCEASGLEGEFKLSPYEQAQDLWSNMIAAAPKYKGEKTLEQHRAEFELWLSSVETRGAADFERYIEDGFYMDWDVQRAWISWKAARGITE